MNKRLLALLMAGTITISGVPFSAMAATEEPAAVVEEDSAPSIVEAVSSANIRIPTAAEGIATNYFTKTIDDLADGLDFSSVDSSNPSNIVIKPTGTLKYISGWNQFSGNSTYQDGYFMPFVLEIPNMTEDTTVNMKNDATSSDQDLTAEQIGTDNKIHVTAFVKANTKITITVDLDGVIAPGYEPITYTIDCSKLELGYTSNAKISLATDSEIDSVTALAGKKLETYGKNLTVTAKGENTYSVTGTLLKQGDTKCYVPLVISVDKSTANSTDNTTNNIVTTSTGDYTASTYADLNHYKGTGSKLALVPVSDPTDDVKFYVDGDGDGEAFNEATITLKMDVALGESTAATFRNVTAEEAGRGAVNYNGSVGKYIEDVVVGGETGLKFEVDPDNSKKINVSGTVKHVSFKNSAGGVADSGYYVPLFVDVTDGDNTSTININSGGASPAKSKMYLHKLSGNAGRTDTATIIVDVDGAGDINDTTYTLDFTNVKTDNESSASFRTFNEAEIAQSIDGVTNLENYIYGGANGITFEADSEDENKIIVKGKLKYNTDGYYLPLVVTPENAMLDGSATIAYTGNGWTGASANDKYNLIKITDNTAKTVTVDGDGSGTKLAQRTYTLDVTNLQCGETTPVEFTLPTDEAIQATDASNANFVASDFVNGNLTYTVDGTTIKVAGKLRKVEDVLANNPTAISNPEDGYFLPITVTIPGATATTINDLDGNTATSAEPKTYVFFLASDELGARKLAKTITVDFDGSGNEYCKMNYTFDLSGIVYYVEGTELEAAAGANIVLDNAAGTVYGAAIGNGTSASATVAEFKKVLANPAGDLEVVEPSGNVLADGANVYSGCKVILKDANDAKIDEATIIIKGTMSTNGKISALDLARFGKFFSNFDGCNDLEKNVYDMNSNGKVDALDLAAFGMAFGQLQ